VLAAVLEAVGQPPVVAACPEPHPADAQALVTVTAAPITPLDLLCASGASYFGTPATPYVPGVQGVGLVEQSDTVPAGSRVWFPTTAGMRPGDGSLAQLCVVPDEDLVVLPDGVDDTTVAALGLSAVAAWMVLSSRAALRAGEQVLVLGAGGVVGQVAVQAARILGARRVVAAARSSAAQDRALAAGADVVVALSSDDDVVALSGRLAEACGGSVDVVVDPLCGVPASAAVRILGSWGRLVNLGSSAGATASFDSAALRSRSAAVLGYTNNDLTRSQRRDALHQVLGHAAAGRLRVAHEVVPLGRVEDAWSRQSAGAASVRIVVQM
jgi:NADPH:quinone reductase-like Zn-dependent oxidoreductase